MLIFSFKDHDYHKDIRETWFVHYILVCCCKAVGDNMIITNANVIAAAFTAASHKVWLLDETLLLHLYNWHLDISKKLAKTK